MKKIKNSSKNVWIFDYDLTLYGQDEDFVLYSMDEGINTFVMKAMNINHTEANDLRRKWWKEHGTTLAGLIHHKKADPNKYFDYIHSHESIKQPSYKPQKIDLFKSINGKKYIFTNGRRDWIDRGLKEMKLEGVFDKILDISLMKWKGKPNINAYRFANVFFDLPKDQPIYFLDDGVDNLLAAKSMNWTTISVGNKSDPNIDYHISDIFELPKILED